MTKNQKYLVVGGVGVAALAAWWLWSNQQHQTAAAQIVSQPPADAVTTSPPLVATSAVTTSAPAASGLSPTQQQELSALMTWTTQTKNPALYQAMMQQLTGAQIDALYNILTTEWTTGAAPTTAQTSFWNTLRQQYPFLNNGGVNSAGALCTNFNCS